MRLKYLIGYVGNYREERVKGGRDLDEIEIAQPLDHVNHIALV
jgi:hypothetical protein